MWLLQYANPNYQGYGISEYINTGGDDYYGDPYENYGQLSGGGNCARNDDGSYHCGNNNNNRNNNNNKKNTNQEYSSRLDCHTLDNDWLLLGVYKEQFYDYFEQISKHLWHYSSYEYTIATKGLDYMGDGDCEWVGTNQYGDYLYKAPMPLQGGGFIIGLYVDDQCLVPNDDDTVNADSVGGNYYNQKIDWNDYYGYGNGYGNVNVEEYTMTLFNEVYESFKYCTLCLDYPSYQDGYFNGDGYDGDDLINQCWKFYSHDTYICDTECVATADAQGTINAFRYGQKVYGK